MKKTITTSVSLLSGIVAMCMIVASASACSCFKAKSAKAGLKSADAVFVGKVVDIGHQKFFTRVKVNMGNGKYKTVTAGEHFYKVKFVVSQSWKGAPSRTTSVLTFLGGEASCGYTFVKGNSYLVYANKEGKRRPNGQNYLHTSTCSRTERILKAKKDLGELGKGKVPLR